MEQEHTQQYNFSYKILPGVFRNDKEAFFEYLKRDGLKFLQFWWDKAGENLPPEERKSSLGMTYELQETPKGGTAVLITLPQPLHHGEAYFLALVMPYENSSIFPWRNLGRVFSLSYLDKENHQSTILGEWTPRGKYIPGEEGLAVDIKIFYLTVIDQIG